MVINKHVKKLLIFALAIIMSISAMSYSNESDIDTEGSNVVFEIIADITPSLEFMTYERMSIKQKIERLFKTQLTKSSEARAKLQELASKINEFSLDSAWGEEESERPVLLGSFFSETDNEIEKIPNNSDASKWVCHSC